MIKNNYFCQLYSDEEWTKFKTIIRPPGRLDLTSE